ncbi:retrovirus-related pol polyprotein from transposon 17.6 [Tanacetum coccineum]
MTPKKNTVSAAAIERLIEARVTEALAAQDVNRSSRNGDDSHDSGSGGLTQWFEKMESVFHTVGHDAAYGMSWKTLMKMMTDKYCPRSEIKKLEIKLWNLKVKGTNVVSYTQRFQELALMCGRMLPKESDEVEKYVGGLPDMIQGNVMAARPKTMQEAIELANDLMDRTIRTFTERQAESKRILDTNSSDNNVQQSPLKRQNVARAYSAVLRVGHLTRDCRNPTAANNQRTPTCFECGNQWHYRSDCPELKNRNRGNQSGNDEACERVYALGGGETDQDPNNMEDDIDA